MPGQSGRTGATPPWSPTILAAIAEQAGFSGQGLVNAVCVAMAESGGNPGATNTNDDSHHSVDRGLWQINNYWHREVSDTCAYTPKCAAGAAHRISNGGSSWSAWATWQNGSAQGNAAAAKAGVDAVRQAGGAGKVLSSQGVDTSHRWGGNGSDASTGGIAGTVEDGVHALEAPLKWGEGLAAFLSKLNDSSVWLRGIEIIGGGALMGVGLVFVAKSVAGDVVASAVLPPGAGKAAAAAKPARGGVAKPPAPKGTASVAADAAAA